MKLYFEKVFYNTIPFQICGANDNKLVISKLVNCRNELRTYINPSLIAIIYCINCTWNLINFDNRLAKKKHFVEITCTFRFRNAFQRVVISSRRLGPSNLSWFNPGIHIITLSFPLEGWSINGSFNKASHKMNKNESHQLASKAPM